jgi:large subunit ribosomal protein L25
MATHRHATLSGERRTTLGKQVSKLRREGKTPGVIYGPAISEPQPITVDEHDLTLTYRRVGASALVDLTVDGNVYPVFIRSVQVEPIRRGMLSVEFYAPEMNQPVTATVSVVTVGELSGTVDGVLTHTRETVEVRGLPDQIPQYLEADISGLTEIDSAVLVSGLALPAGIEVLTPGDEIVVKLAAPARVETPPSPEEVLAEATGDLPAAVNEGAEPVEEPGS